MHLSWPVQKFVNVFGAMLFASMKDSDDRPAMCGVHVERFDHVLTVGATNGHWLLRWREVEGMTDERGEVIDRIPFAVTIPRRSLESFLAALKKPLDLERCNLAMSGTSGTLATILDVRVHDFTRVAEEFPPLDIVIPTKVAPKLRAITLASDLFVSVARAWNRAGGGSMHMQMAGDELSPVVVTSPSIPELTAVVMPLRPADENALDEVPVADAGVAAPERDDLTREMFPGDDAESRARATKPDVAERDRLRAEVDKAQRVSAAAVKRKGKGK